MLIPRQLDGFDVEGAIERMLDSPELWWQAVALFFAHFERWGDAWRASIGDDGAERKQVHALRSAADNIGAVRLAAQAARLEKALLGRLGGKSEAIGDDWRDGLASAFADAMTAIARAGGRRAGDA